MIKYCKFCDNRLPRRRKSFCSRLCYIAYRSELREGFNGNSALDSAESCAKKLYAFPRGRWAWIHTLFSWEEVNQEAHLVFQTLSTLVAPVSLELFYSVFLARLRYILHQRGWKYNEKIDRWERVEVSIEDKKVSREVSKVI